jgi:hypothetical protein
VLTASILGECGSSPRRRPVAQDWLCDCSNLGGGGGVLGWRAGKAIGAGIACPVTMRYAMPGVGTVTIQT